MKRFLLILAILSAGTPLFAGPVSPVSAKSFAGKYFNRDCGDLKLTSSTDILKGKGGDDRPTFYIINNPSGGWLILSGDDCTYPVLGYSDKGAVTSGELPPNAGFWLSRLDGNIKALRKAGTVRTREVREKWEGLGLKTKASSGGRLLQTADWDQGTPYNNLCPNTEQGKPTLTGCVATAMAIVLRYHKWPEHGKGTLESYTTRTHQLKIDGFSIDTHTYNWDNMPLKYSNTSSAAQKSEVARLMYDCGVMVQMDYDPTGSAAYSSDIIPALAAHMSYKAGAMELYHSNYSDREWLKMIRDEILADRPVIYGGGDIYDTKVGHQFVCDGFDDNGMIHINWGWNGDYNGYYAVTYIGAKEQEGVFNYYDSAVFGLEPDPAGTSKPNATLYLYGSSSGGMNGISLLEGKIGQGSEFMLSFGYICNDSYDSDYDGAVKAALIDRKGTVKEFIGEEVGLKVKASASNSTGYGIIEKYACRISSTPVPGDAIVLFYKLSDGRWVRMGGDIPEHCTVSALGAFDYSFINVEDSYKSGQNYYFDLVAGQKVITETVNYFDNVECTKGYVTLTPGPHTVSVTLKYKDGSSETIEQKIRVD